MTIDEIKNTTYELSGNTLTYTANSGYVFTTAPKGKLFDEWDNMEILTATLSEDKKQAVFTNENFPYGATFEITSGQNSVVKESSGPDLSAFTVNTLPNTTNEIGTKTLTVTCGSGYVFDGVPVLSYLNEYTGDEIRENGVVTDNIIATFDLTNFDGAGESTLTGNVIIAEQPTEMIEFVTDLSGCTSSGVPTEPVPSDSVINITLTANSGFVFKEIPYLYYINSYFSDEYINFTLSNDGKTASVSQNLGLLDFSRYDIAVHGVAAPDTDYGDRYGTINIYKTNVEQLNEFALQRKYPTTGSSGALAAVDLGEFVVSIRRFFFSVGDSIESTITAGDVDTQIESATPVNDVIHISCGSVEIPTHNNDTADRISEIRMFVPFVGFTTLTGEYVGKTVSLDYDIDIVSGGGAAKLSCDGNTFAVFACKTFADVDFKTGSMRTTSVSMSNDTDPYLFGMTPYVLYKWYESKNDRLLNNDCKRVKIGECVGIVKLYEVTDIESGQITADEKNNLMRIISQGICIE